MKNSLFKRAFALATAVPLALTQCLSVANAVSVNNAITALPQSVKAIEPKETSVNSLIFIEPTEGLMNAETYERVGNTFVKDSEWNKHFLASLKTMEENGTLDLSSIYEEIINNAGSYGDVVKSAIEKVGDVTYSVDSEKNIIRVHASLDNITPILEDEVQARFGEKLKKLAEGYNIADLDEIKFFDKMVIAGDFDIEIDASALENGTLVSGSVSFTDKATGKVYKDISITKYITDTIKAVQTSIESTIDDLIDQYNLDRDGLEKLVQESDEYNKLFNDLKNGYTPADGEIESMIFESVEFKNLVNDYMAKNGVDYEEAEAKVKESDKYKDLMDRFTNGINLSDDEIKEILSESDEYNELVEKYMADNAVDYDEAVNGVLDSPEYKELLDSYTDKYTYDDDEIKAMIHGSADYQNKMNEIQAEYDDVFAKAQANAAEAKAQIDKYVKKAENAISKGLEKYDTVKNYKTPKPKHFDSYTEMAEAINNNKMFNKVLDYAENKAPDKIANKIPDGVPTDPNAIAANKYVQKIFNTIINQLAPENFAVTPEDMADIAAKAYDIEVTANVGELTFTAKLPDEDTSDLKNHEGDNSATYIADTYNVDVEKVYKEATIVLDFTNLDIAGNASVDFKLKRIVEVKDITTTTTTASTTATSTTVDPSQTSTSTATVDPSQTSTSTATVDPSQTSTSTATVDPSQTSTSTATVDPSQTSTTTDPNQSILTTTVSAEYTVDISVETAVDGFYLSIDKSFNKEQVKSITYKVDTKYTTFDAEGNIINEETVKNEASGDITDKFVFDDTPESVFTPIGENEKPTIDNFKYAVSLYAAEDIVAENGAVIANAGEVIASTDGTEAAITAYVGVKGDADLDGMATSTDMALTLIWYGAMSTLKNPAEVIFSTSELVIDPDTEELIDATLDEFAAFLADVDNENTEGNWKMTKPERLIDGADGTFILATYGKTSTGILPTRELWNDILGDEYAKKDEE